MRFDRAGQKVKILARLTIASAMPARLIGIAQQHAQNGARVLQGFGVCSVSMLVLCDLGFVFGGLRFPRPASSFDWRGRCFLDRRFAVQSMLVAVMMQSHLSVPPRPVHRINVRVKEYLVEVPDDDRQGRQHRFIEVNGGRDIQPPARHMIAHENFGPQHDAGDGHDDHAPDQSPVFGFFRVVEAARTPVCGK